MLNLMSSARAVVVVSHDMGSLARLCDRVVWLDHGRIRQTGPAQEVIDAYTQHAQQGSEPAQRQAA
jgi:ABC-type polysaccharide/polyol phosphate transport system ATPase subunit